MSRNIVRATGALVLLALLLTPLAVIAHEKVEAGDYVIEYGWANEPPVVGQPNAIVINISGKSAESSHDMGGSISLVSPADGSTVHGDSTEVAIKTEGVEKPEDLHWHLYVDDKELSMIPLAETTVTVTGLSNGMHTIKVAIAASDHGEIGEPAQAMITVEGSSASGDMTVTGMESMAGGEDHGGEGIDVDVFGLTVELEYGGQTKMLELKPLAGGVPGQFVAPVTPTRAGQYTLKFSGKLTGALGDADVSTSVEPEEVAVSDPNAFPSVAAETQTASSNELGLAGWLGIGGLVAGLLGLVVSLVALTRKK
ncbi:MAG TPA: hypothetical protein VJL59_12375 [Anaerolineales bacterium]|nr:hypothetical protein [Anaerolineales bacterium]